ncbi:bifunctional diguanylate cyclase/phosphodiesterase [Massilia sp. DWR3-1-1]|uniref:bifunctional diguanylate cyclase/phosphodiesterase n=1 Tax=Massilia sp. DWR3-1-1 TaxID=2804559 RepID=UPI003CE96591
MRQRFKSSRLGNAGLAMFKLGAGMPWSLPLFAALLLIGIWCATLHFIEIERAYAVRAASASLADLIDTYEAQVARNVGGIEQTLKTVNYAVKLHGTAGALAALQGEDLLPSALIYAVSVAGADGTVMASHPASSVASVARQAFFRYHLGNPSDAVLVSGASDPRQTEKSVVHFSKRLTDGTGRFIGVAVLDVDPAYFTSAYEPSRQGAQGMLALYSAPGTWLAVRVGEHLAANRAGAAPLADPLAAAPAAWDGVKRFSAVRQMRRLQLAMVVGLGEQEQMAAFEARRVSRLWQAGGASVLLLALVGAVWLWSRQGAETRRSIRLAQQTYEAASESNQDAFFVLHSVVDEGGAIVDFRISAANRQAETLTGLSREDLQRKTVGNWMPEAYVNGTFERLVHATSMGGVHETEVENTTTQLKGAWLHRQLVGVEGGVVAIIRDVSERRMAEAKILHMARHDALTGMPNRTLLHSRLVQAISHAQRRHGAVVVAFVDLDNFKMVNDGLGHKGGDELLAQIAGRMRQCLRRQDTLGRFGGDEFVLILPVYRQRQDDCVALLERINEVVRQPLRIDDHALQVSCSIGVALYPRDGDNADSLLVHADVAMYSAKAAGKNQCRWYTEAMNAKAEHKLALVEQLRGALDGEQFKVVYQPKFDVGTGLMFGLEALVRWHHPERGVISPLDFIPLAEESGVIVAIGRWVLHSACAQSAAWQRAGLPPLVMSVNVSPRQFDDTHLLSDVGAALEASGLAPHLLELEVTESLIMRDLQGAVEKMARLKAMGLLLSIDDFGTGYSSLSSLKTFPITTLKIDKSFIGDLATSADDQAIARAIIALAHQLNLRVIAEGVETQEQFAFLRDNGCDEVQGYLFGRPASAQQIGELLQRQRHAMLAAPDGGGAGSGWAG